MVTEVDRRGASERQLQRVGWGGGTNLFSCHFFLKVRYHERYHEIEDGRFFLDLSVQ